MYEIIKNIKLPETSAGAPRLYPTLDIGDGFICPDTKKKSSIFNSYKRRGEKVRIRTSDGKLLVKRVA